MSRTRIVAAIALVGVGAWSATASADERGRVEGTVKAERAKHRRDVVVYLTGGKTKVVPPKQPAIMDQSGMVFRPHVLPIVTGTTVKFLNNDVVTHNVFSPDHDKYNLGVWNKGSSRSHTFSKPGVYRQLCKLHVEMQAFVVVLDTPYFAVTDADGDFSIGGVPPGTYELHVWSEKRRAESQTLEVSADDAVRVDIELVK